MEKIIPTYEFKKDVDETVSPVLRPINKTMMMTEEFTLLSVLKHVATMKKAIADKRSEADGLEAAMEEYLKEVAIIEEQLDITNLETEFIKLEAAEVAKEGEVDNG